MEFIETSVFTKQIHALLDDGEYGDLQYELAQHPKAGDVIPGGNGLRKIRWRSRQKGGGKRGGVRIIYYCRSEHQLYMLFAFEKSQQGDLTKEQLRTLSAYVKDGVL